MRIKNSVMRNVKRDWYSRSKEGAVEIFIVGIVTENAC